MGKIVNFQKIAFFLLKQKKTDEIVLIISAMKEKGTQFPKTVAYTFEILCFLTFDCFLIFYAIVVEMCAQIKKVN